MGIFLLQCVRKFHICTFFKDRKHNRTGCQDFVLKTISGKRLFSCHMVINKQIIPKTCQIISKMLLRILSSTVPDSTAFQVSFGPNAPCFSHIFKWNEIGC